MKETKPNLLLEGLAEDVSSMRREVDGKKFVAENLAGNFLLHAILVELSKVSNAELLRDTIFSLPYFSKGLIGYQEK